jgi:hypothetical protein
VADHLVYRRVVGRIKVATHLCGAIVAREGQGGLARTPPAPAAQR